MDIKWDKIPNTDEGTFIAEYIENKIILLENLFELYLQEELFIISFTPPPLNGNFYTYQIKYHQHDDRYLIIVWNGVRTGDSLPILYGYLIIN